MRILWLKTGLLHPVDNGGNIRTYQMLKEMKRHHHIIYLALNETAGDSSSHEQAYEYCHELICVPHRTELTFTARFYAKLALNLVSTLPYFIQKYRSSAMAQRIMSALCENKPDLLVCDFLHPTVNIPDLLPCPSVLFQHNVEAMIWQRHFEVQANPLKRAYLYIQWRKTHRYEHRACRRFDRVVAVSINDGETMKREYGLCEVPNIPTGVDIEHFKRNTAVFQDPHHLVFTGSMDWLPNEDGVLYFVNQVLPRVRRVLPDVRLTVVGRNPYPRLVRLSRHDHSITVTGRVDDVRPYLERASAYIVPIRIGGGTRLKVYEAMAMGMPGVSTRVGAEGLPVLDGQHLLIADSPEDFATAVVRVLTDIRLARALGAQAAAMVRERFGWGDVTTEFSLICQKALQEFQQAKGKAARTESLDPIV